MNNIAIFHANKKNIFKKSGQAEQLEEIREKINRDIQTSVKNIVRKATSRLEDEYYSAFCSYWEDIIKEDSGYFEKCLVEWKKQGTVK